MDLILDREYNNYYTGGGAAVAPIDFDLLSLRSFPDARVKEIFSCAA